MTTTASRKDEASTGEPPSDGVGVIRRLTRPFERFGDRAIEPQPYVEGETQLRKLMTWPAVSGAAGSLLILWGASQTTSPFTLNRSSHTLSVPQLWPTWFFGTGPVAPEHPNLLIGVVMVYAGMFLMIRAWLGLIRMTRLHPGIPVRRLVPVFIAWMLPLLVVAPLFSHDVYSYVAQGEEVSYRINPYKYAPSVLGVGGNSFASSVDTLWLNHTSPYGPVFMWLAGAVLKVVGHDELAALVGFRVLAVAGTVLMAVFIPRLAASYGHDPAKAFVLVALNPIVLLHLVAGEHNDALMLGLLVAGLSLARDGHRIVGVAVCTAAALVKVPALVGVVYIGWDWLGDGIPIRRRIKPTIGALALSAALTAGATYLIGFGWGWVGALANPGSVASWMDPANGVGDLIGKLVNGVGLGDHTSSILLVCKLLAGIAGVAFAVWLLLKADGPTIMRAIGLTLIVAVVFSPTVQPWYFAWGVVILATIAEKRILSGVVALSAVMAFLGLPGGKEFVTELGQADPFAVASAAAGLVVVAAILFGPQIRAILEDRRKLRDAAAAGALESSGRLALADGRTLREGGDK